MKLPTELQIMGQKVKIEYHKGLLDDEGNEASGLCYSGQNLIKICLKENTNEAAALSTLGHEMFHFVVAKCGLSEILGENEESLAIGLEENFLPLFNFNRRKWKKKEEVEYGSEN